MKEKKKFYLPGWKHTVGIFVGILTLGLLVYGGLNIWQANRRREAERKKTEVFPGIKVEVLNAAGEPGLAKKVTWRLRGMGFDVVYYGNANDTLSKTVVIERVDSSMANAKSLAGAIGVKEITYEPDPDQLFDVTLLVGLDFKEFFKDINKDEVIY
ncbi:MAG: LytR C-terminal domain-containing protein [candidate division WOR-3 bacterium]